ncbi:MAG TPA: hypothetical protein VFG54_12490 [Prolixibacteraceae bacterium]|nr:hypothetical protein [Prolixibacteraceae bacterium]
MRELTRFLLLMVLALLIAPWKQVKAQEDSLHVYLNSGGTFLDGSQELIGCIGEPVIGFLSQDWQHCLQGFAYKTMELKIITPIQDLLNLKVHVNLFPNPVNKILNVKYEGVLTGEEKYLISDENGRRVLTGFLTDPITQVKTENLSPGPYIFLLINNTTQKKIYHYKFVKLK